MVDAGVPRREFLKFLPFMVLAVEGLALNSVPRAFLKHPFPAPARVTAWPKPLGVTTRSFLCSQAGRPGRPQPPGYQAAMALGTAPAVGPQPSPELSGPLHPGVFPRAWDLQSGF